MLRDVCVGLAAALPVIGTLAVSAEAQAGTYEVWTCRGPDGAPAVVRDEAGGWQPERVDTNPNGGNQTVEGCAVGGAINATLGSSLRQPAPSWLLWRFLAPAATTIQRYEVDFDGYARPSETAGPARGGLGFQTSLQSDPVYAFWFIGKTGNGHLERRILSGNGEAASYLEAHVTCAPLVSTGAYCDPGTDGAPARINIYRGTFTLQDREAPTVTAVSGDAVSNSVWAGPTGISVAAADQGGGVHRLGVEVDGQMRSWIVLAGAPCASWPGRERVFVSPKPCPSSVGGVQTISTDGLPEGTHTVRVVVEDAAGNQTTAYGPTTKTLRRTASSEPDPSGLLAPPAPAAPLTAPPPGAVDLGPENGSPASSDARLRARWDGREGDLRTSRYNQRPVLNGQLTTAAGQPIRDALVRVTITRHARRSPALERDSLRTDRDGRFRWKQPAGASSQSIRLAYHRRLHDGVPVATRTLQLEVRAALRLRLSRKTARRGQSVRLTGSLLGRPLPAIGKVVELQARNPGGRWITFRTVRSRKGGRFVASYRFRKPGPARFQMRVRARRSGDYPYATGASPVRTIVVR